MSAFLSAFCRRSRAAARSVVPNVSRVEAAGAVVEESRAKTTDRLIYYGAKFLAQVAQNLFLAALFVIAGTGPDAAIGLSGMFLATLLPAVAFGLLGGAVVDRIGSARGYVLGALLRFLPVLAAVTVLHGPAWAWVMAFAYGTGSQVFGPSEMALVKTIQRDAPGRAHSLLVALQYGGQGVGMLVLAPALWFLGGTSAMLTGAALGLAALVVVTLVLALRLRRTPAARTQPSRSAFSFGQTCRFFLSEPRARYAVIVMAFKVIVARGIVVTLPFYIQHDMGLGREAVVFLLVPGIAGTLAGLGWSARAVTLDRATTAMRMALVGMIVSVAALAALDYGLTAVAQYSQVPPLARLEASLNSTFLVAVPVAFLLGLTLSGGLVSARVALTETAPLGQQARVFAVQATVTEALMVLPLTLTGVGTEYAGARVTLAAIGVLAFAALAVMELPVVSRRRAAGVAVGY